MNDRERAQWINNDENLYIWRRQVGGAISKFIRDHRAEITLYIEHEQHKHDGNGGTNCRFGCPYYRRWK